jgi:hypothetical protein
MWLFFWVGGLIMRNFEPNLYGALVSVRNVYVQTQWTQAQIAVVLHTVALPVVFIPTTDPATKLVVSVVGLIVTFIGFFAITDVVNRINFIDCRLADMERLDTNSEDASRVLVFANNKYKVLSHNGQKFRLGMTLLFVFWCIEIVITGYSLASLKHWL